MRDVFERYSEWQMQRRRLSELEENGPGVPAANEWQGSDDDAVELLESAMAQLVADKGFAEIGRVATEMYDQDPTHWGQTFPLPLVWAIVHQQRLADFPPDEEPTGYLLDQTYGYADLPDGWVSVQADDSHPVIDGGDRGAAYVAAAANGNLPVAFFWGGLDDEGLEMPGDWAVYSGGKELQ